MGQIIRLNHRKLHRSISSRPSSTSANKLYSDTLLLPKTTFPLRPSDPEENEARLCLRTTKNLWDWQSKQLGRPSWTIHDGPPYANGSLHMGHALNKILKDIINRNKLLHGFRVNYIPGFDCHGLPLELKAIDSARAALSAVTELEPVQIRDAARKTAAGGVEVQVEEFSRLSILADWRHAWRTMDHDYEIKQLHLFGQMVKNQLICRHRKPVHFSPSSGTALAEAEIEYRDDHLSRSVYVAFDVVHRAPVLQATIQKLNVSAKLKIVVWTTTPWTLVANQAVVVSKMARYSLVKRSVNDSGLDEILIFATNRLQTLQDLLSDHPQNFEVIAELSGEELASSTYTHDFTSMELPLFTADHVTVESGSGLVHTAPSHGLEDFHSYRAFMATHQPHQPVSYIDIVDDQGRFKCGDQEEWKKRLHEKEVLQAGNHEVICMMHEQRRLIGKEVIIRHKYPYDWRTKKPILTR